MALPFHVKKRTHRSIGEMDTSFPIHGEQIEGNRWRHAKEARGETPSDAKGKEEERKQNVDRREISTEPVVLVGGGTERDRGRQVREPSHGASDPSLRSSAQTVQNRPNDALLSLSDAFHRPSGRGGSIPGLRYIYLLVCRLAGPVSLVVRIPRCGRGDLGSTPRLDTLLCRRWCLRTSIAGSIPKPWESPLPPTPLIGRYGGHAFLFFGGNGDASPCVGPSH